MSNAEAWQQHLRDFEGQLYPTAEETANNNASVLYKRKKFFLTQLRHDIKCMGFIVLVMTYLKDISMLRLMLRGFLQYTLSNPYPAKHLYTEDSKKGLTKWLLISIFSLNGFCLMMHLLFGAYKTNPLGGSFLYGGMSVEFIGELVPNGRGELIIYDGLIFGSQLVLHTLMCYIDDTEVLQTKQLDPLPSDDLMEKVYDNNDGYNGNVMVVSIDLVDTIQTVLQYDHAFQLDSYTTTTNYDLPGRFTT